MEKLQVDKWASFKKYLQELRKSRHIEILGPNLKKPIPEDFELDSNQLSIAQSDYIENQKIEIENKKILEYERQSIFLKYGHIIGLLIAYLFFPRVKKLSILGINYAKYLEAEKAYKEVLEDKEKEKIEELRRKEANYWFSLGGHEFEEEVSKLFRRSGHFSSVEKTKGSGDGGIDIILTVSDGTKIFVQCKAHKTPVGPHVARDLYGAMQSAGVNDGIIINLTGFTQGVRDFIKGKNISMFDVNSIIKMQNMTLK
ncbi:MAG: restriction endonuclease [Planctomycetaceae bacterium]|nr:restriction endonuclease [Planctomycetaceae bacterium]